MNPPIVQVNENGIVLGPVSYEIAHDKKVSGIRHQTASLLLFENNNYERFLYTVRSAQITSGERWDVSAGGHSIYLEERAQTPEETIIHEIMDELFSGRLPSEFGRLEKIVEFKKELRPHDLEYVHLFRGVWTGPFDYGEEVIDGGFISPKEFLDMASQNPQQFTKSSPYYVKKYLESIGSS